MEFKAWMTENGLTQSEVAAELCVCQQMVCRVASGKYPVSLGLSLRIQVMTGGEVEARDLTVSEETWTSLGELAALVKFGATFE